VKTMQVHVVACYCLLCIQIRLHVVLHSCFVSTLTAGSEGVPKGICPQAAAWVCGDCARVSTGFKSSSMLRIALTAQCMPLVMVLQDTSMTI
jgi:hypothetical protein